MVDSTKVLCALFDKITILISGDSPSIFPSLDKMGVGPQRTEKGKMKFSLLFHLLFINTHKAAVIIKYKNTL